MNKLVGNPKVARYPENHQSEFLIEFSKIVQMTRPLVPDDCNCGRGPGHDKRGNHGEAAPWGGSIVAWGWRRTRLEPIRPVRFRRPNSDG
jgi:hypothetical protein